MPWRTATVREERARFVFEAKQGFLDFAELCRRYGISRKTGYKWIDRYDAEGLDGLEDRSHRTHRCPHRTPKEIEERILAIRRHRGWGAKKIGAVLRRERGSAPSRDTIHRILVRHGCVEHRKPRRRREHPAAPISPMDRPNAVWSTDFKGHFLLGNGSYCHPLTVQDAFSRYVLACRALSRPRKELVIPWFKRLFSRFGVPDRIRTDNGPPFASANALGGLSELNVWWIRIGIVPERIEPGKPQQNGRHERMHRTLKRRTALPPADNLRAQQARFDRWRRTFNQERPHEALDLRTPDDVYRPSSRRLPGELREQTYPPHFEVRKVAQDSTIRWKARKVFVTSLIHYDYVGLEEVGEDLWSVFYGPLHLGWLDEKDYRIMDVKGRRRKR